MKNTFELLRTEKIEENIFKGQTVDIGAPQLYGGLVLGQALYSSAQTVSPDRIAHSLHAYFILPGDPNAPVVYQIERIRDGRSFTTRRIVAVQHGRPIFNMSASFQLREEGISHQMDHPEVPGPDGLKNLKELNLEAAERTTGPVSDYLRNWSESKWPVEMRPIHEYDPLNPKKREPNSGLWFRILTDMPKDDLIYRQAVLACISDYALLSTALLPHGITWINGVKQGASLDHSMWLHHDYDPGDWMLSIMDSPKATNARGLTRASIYSKDGKLIASTAQEGMIRT